MMLEQIPNIRHLAAFAATVKHGSATRAATAVNLTQPALTQAISRLEAKLGCQLFEREPNGMRPTDPALLLAPRISEAIEKIGSNRVTATQMRAFLALARSGSYAAAAERTGVAPASLHRAVSDLALSLEERLVERRGRHLVLTRKGERRARNLGLALAEIRSGFAEIDAWMGKAAGKIVIGAMPLSRARWLPQSILALEKKRTGVKIVVVEGSYNELSGPLRDGEVDFLLGALRQEESLDDLVQTAVFEDRPKVIMRKSHPLSGERQLTNAQLCEFPWILPGNETPLHRYWSDMLGQSRESVEHGIECGSVLTIRELLLETDLLTLLSPDQLRVEIEAGLLVASATPAPVKRMIGITTRRDWRPTALQAEMLSILNKVGIQIS